MNRNLLLGLAVFVLCVWIWREVSWSQHSKRLESGRVELRDALSSVYSISTSTFKGQLQGLSSSSSSSPFMETLSASGDQAGSKGRCVANSNAGGIQCQEHSASEENSGKAKTTGAEAAAAAACSVALTKISALIAALPYVMDHVQHGFKTSAQALVFKGSLDWLVLLGMLALMQVEVRYCHTHQHANPRTVDMHDKHVARHLFLYYSRQYPVSNMLFYAAVLLLSSVAWIGVYVDRETLVKRLLRLCIFWLISSYLSVVCVNIRALGPYLPSTLDDALPRLRSKDWWLWFLPRALLFGPGLDSLTLTHGAAWALLHFLQFWPLRYFFVNTDFACADHTSARLTDVFVCRMLIHLAFLKVWQNYTVLTVVGLPAFLRLPYEVTISVSTLAAMANSALCLLCVLWFALFSSSCGWWTSIVALSFMNSHIAACVSVAMPVTVQFHRQSPRWLQLRAWFVSAYTDTLVTSYPSAPAPAPAPAQGEGQGPEPGPEILSSQTASSSSSSSSDADSRRLVAMEKEKEREQLREEGQFFFDQVLQAGCHLHLWLPAHDAADTAAAADKETPGKGDGENGGGGGSGSGSGSGEGSSSHETAAASDEDGGGTPAFLAAVEDAVKVMVSNEKRRRGGAESSREKKE